MKALALLFVTFCAASSFAQPVQFLKNSQLPKQLQVLAAQTLAYDCSGLIESDSTVEEQETEISKTAQYETDYTTSFKITFYTSYKYMPKTISMTVFSSNYKGDYTVNSFKSRVCSSIDD